METVNWTQNRNIQWRLNTLYTVYRSCSLFCVMVYWVEPSFLTASGAVPLHEHRRRRHGWLQRGPTGQPTHGRWEATSIAAAETGRPQHNRLSITGEDVDWSMTVPQTPADSSLSPFSLPYTSFLPLSAHGWPAQAFDSGDGSGIGQYSIRFNDCSVGSTVNAVKHKKAELSQRWRIAPYVWVPWKFLGLPDFAHGYFSQNFNGLLFRLSL